MNKKTIFKWLSLFLVTILFINSNTVLLNELSRIMVVNAQENTKEIQEEINPKEVVSEIIEKREKNVKHFKLSDGSYVAAIYPEAVHYKRDGEWVDIDNSLIELIDEHGKKSYTNANNSWEITIKEEAYNRDHVTLQKGEYEISWSMLNQKNTKMTMEIKEKANNKHIDRENIKQKVHFTNILDNVDIEYILHGEYLKENVILHNKPNSDFNYTYIAKLKNLKAELLEDNSILFYDENDVDKKEVFLMEAPFMIDSAGNYSEDIRVHLIETSSGLSITYIPNNDWLTDDERHYPVTIDPTVRTSDSVYAIKDSSVVEGNPTHNYNGTYLDALLLRVGEHSTTKSNESYIKFDLPEFNTGDMVTYAQLNLYLSHDEANSNQVNVRKVLEDWDSFQITWNNRPNYDQTTVYDYSNVVGSKYDGFTWDITGIVKEWYNGFPNYGLAIESDPSENQYSELYGSDTDEYLTPMRPSIAMYYVNNTGLEPHWTYHTQSNGRAGTGYINDYNGNLVFTHSDFAMNGNRMPLSVQHVFNSNNKDTDKGLGLGWITNLNQKIKWASFDGTSYYIYTDEDGTEHYLKNTSSYTFTDESGLNISLRADANNPEGKYVLTDKYENKLIFDDNTLLLKNIINTKGDQITIKYDSSGNVVTAIDGVGRVTNFNYSNSLLSNIVTPDNKVISYGYDGSNRLTSITYSDNKSSLYTYDNNNNLLTVKNVDNKKISYEYYTNSPYRVKSVQELYNEGQVVKDGLKLDINYGFNTTIFTDYKDRKNVYQFNDWGNTVLIKDYRGRAQYYKYGSNENFNKIETSSRLQETTNNLLLDHSAENNRSEWVPLHGPDSVASLSFSNEESFIGIKSLKVDKTNNLTRSYYQQKLNLEKGKTYTFSAYIKTKNISDLQNNGGHIIVWYKDKNDIYNSVQSSYITGTNDWQRISVKFTLPFDSTSSEVLFRSEIHGETGIAYFDNLQVEEDTLPNRYNLIDNGDFRYGSTIPDLFNQTGNTDVNDKIVTNDNGVDLLDNNVYMVNGDAKKSKRLTQNVKVSGLAGDTFVFSSWGKGNSVSLKNDTSTTRLFGVRVTINHKDGSTQEGYVSFNEDTTEWQYISDVIVANEDYDSIDYEIVYENNENIAYFDGLGLFREAFGVTYQYDSEGNVVSSVDVTENNSAFEYDGNNDLIENLSPEGYKYNYEYNDKHQVTKATSSSNIVYSFEYDSNDNPIKTRVEGVSLFIESEYEYDLNGNYLRKYTDSRGNTTEYNYNNISGELDSIIDAKDNRVNYSYDELKRLSGVSNKDSFVNYLYENDRLVQTQTNGVTYSFEYDELGKETKIYVNDILLTENIYQVDNGIETGRLDSVIYGNGNNISYEYDEYNRVTAIITDGIRSYEYTYDNSNQLAEVNDLINSEVVNYEYDLLGRLVKIKKSNGDRVSFIYNQYNKVEQVIEKIDGKYYSTSYTYDRENRISDITYYDLPIVSDSIEFFPLITNTYSLNSIRPIVESKTFEFDNNNKPVYGSYNGSTNLLSNSNFENGLNNWTETSWTGNDDVTGNTIVINEGLNGKSSIMQYDTDGLLDGSNTNTVTYQFITFTSELTTDTEYTLSSYSKRIGNTNPKLGIRCYDANGQTITNAYWNYEKAIPENEWTRIDQTFTLPAGTKKIQVLVRSSVKDRDIVMFDNVQLEKREYTTYYTESNMSSPKNEYDLDINLDSGSFSAWIKPGKNKDYNRQIINNTTTNDSILHLYINTNDELKLAVKKNTTTNWNILSSTEVLNIDEWSFVGFSWKYDNEILKLKLYLNDKIYTKDITDYKDFTGDLTYLGSTYTGGNHLNGQMESVLYSPEQLTDSDFQTLYNKGRSSNVHYTYDELGRVNKVTLVTNDIKKEQHYEYLSGINGSETSLVSGLTTKIFNNLDVQVVNEVFGYEYDKIGNISKITHPDGNTSEFTYDHLNQLLTETHSSTNEKITYDYEGIGNIKKVTTEDISGSIGSTLKEYRYITADGTWSDWIPYTNLTEIEHNINIKDIPNKGKLFNEYELTTEDVNYKIVDGVPSLEFDGISSRASSRNYLEFDGVNDYVSLTNLPVHSTDAVTLSARIYWDGLTQDISTGSDRGTIITLGGSYYLQLMTDGRIAVYTYPDSSASTYDYSNSIIPKHEWVDVTFTEKNGLRKIYINGVLDNTIQRESSIRYQTTSTYIGSENNSIRYFNGKISDASVWNKELTQTEIQNLNSNGLAGNESGLLAHYNFDSMNGTLIDRSVNTNNGAITGATYPGNANLNIKSLFFELTTDNTGGMPVSFDDIEFVWYRGGLDIYNNNYRQRTDTNAPLNQKFKLAIIWNGTNYEFYVDGTKYSSYVYSGTQTLMDISEVTLGYGMYNDNYYFDGSLHDVRFSTMQLSDQQAKDITSGALDVNEVLNDDNTEIIYNFIEFRETDTLANTTHIDEVNYTYSTEWQDQLLSYDGYDITYDSMGNPLTIKKGTQTYYTFEWQGGRQLKKMYVYRGHLGQNDIDITYKYNDSGYRTEKSITDKVTLVTTTTKYTLAGSNVIEEVTGSDKIHYTYDAANKLISMTLNDSTYYYLRNGRGDIVGLVDDNGNKVVSYEYDSWGKLLNITDTSGVDLGNKNPYRYRGYRYDNESSLYYLNSRYYNPDSKRFINADAIIGVTGDILSYNMYAYAKNNPINMADPSGYLSTWKKIGLTVAIVAVVAIGTVATGGLLSAGLIGASMSSTIVGGLFGAGLNMASQVVFEDKGLKEIDYGEVAISGISGAISGRIGAANIHKVGQGISNAVINGTASYIQDRDAKKALAAGVIGGVGGFLGGNGAKYDKIKGGVKYLKVSQYSKDKLIFDFAKKGIWKSNSWSKAFEKTADIAMDLIK